MFKSKYDKALEDGTNPRKKLVLGLVVLACVLAASLGLDLVEKSFFERQQEPAPAAAKETAEDDAEAEKPATESTDPLARWTNPQMLAGLDRRLASKLEAALAAYVEDLEVDPDSTCTAVSVTAGDDDGGWEIDFDCQGIHLGATLEDGAWEIGTIASGKVPEDARVGAATEAKVGDVDSLKYSILPADCAEELADAWGDWCSEQDIENPDDAVVVGSSVHGSNGGDDVVFEIVASDGASYSVTWKSETGAFKFPKQEKDDSE